MCVCVCVYAWGNNRTNRKRKKSSVPRGAIGQTVYVTWGQHFSFFVFPVSQQGQERGRAHMTLPVGRNIAFASCSTVSEGQTEETAFHAV